MNRLIYCVAVEHQLVLSSFIIDEIIRVVGRKFKGKEEAIDIFLSQLPYELVYTPSNPKRGLFTIRDEMDYPVLYSAITEDVDVFITGDKDFEGLGLEKPEIITPTQFIEKYCAN